MKYIKIFESFYFDVGDYIVLLKTVSKSESKLGFVTGNIYKIAYIDKHDNAPYAIKKVNDSFQENYIWIETSQMRKATQEEIDAMKYNL